MKNTGNTGAQTPELPDTAAHDKKTLNSVRRADHQGKYRHHTRNLVCAAQKQRETKGNKIESQKGAAKEPKKRETQLVSLEVLVDPGTAS